MAEPLSFDSTDDLSLEGELDAPPSPKAVIVICHPHPKMGGTMSAPLLLALRDELVPRGWAVLRFNFRGIGKSQGQPSTGLDEVADAEGALREAKARYPQMPLAIAGWSFGGAVALRVAADTADLVACATIAPSIVAKPDVTAGAPPADEFRTDADLLIVCGANDEQVSPADCRRWAEAAGGRYEEVSGANHFFWARYDALAALVCDFLDDAVS